MLLEPSDRAKQFEYDSQMLEYFRFLFNQAARNEDDQTKEECEWILSVYDRLEDRDDEVEKQQERIIELQDYVEYLEERYEPLD